jgi:hypothetical protein
LVEYDYLNERLSAEYNRLTQSLLYSEKEEKELTKDEIEDIVSYLHNPTKKGIWSLKAKWNIDRGFFRFIESEIDEYIRANEKLSIIFGKREIIVDIKNPEIISKIKKDFKRFTFIVRLFTYINKIKMSTGEQSSDFLRSNFNQDDIVIFEMLDIEKIEENYRDAYNIFVTDIFCNELTSSIQEDMIFKFNKGNFILTGLDKSISIISISGDSIKIIRSFLESLNLIEEVRLEAQFTPEEVIFDQYITFLKEVYPKIIEYHAFIRLMQQGISEFSHENYSNFIGTVGIMTEDLLIQIFETFFRDEAPKNLSMGQMADQIQKKILENLSSESVKPSMDLNNLYKEVNSILEGVSQDTDAQKKTLELIRKVLQYIKEQNESTRDIIKKKLSPEAKISIFPRKIQSNLNELLKYRNAISHKSNIPIGKYEATRTVFCFMTLLIWWNNERIMINWDDTEEGIIKTTVERNKNI